MALAAAAIYMPFVSGRCVPEEGLHLAVGWLGLTPLPVKSFPLWGWLVRKVGADPLALGCISMASAILCVALVASVTSGLMALAVWKARKKGAKGANEFAFAEPAAVLLACASFVFTPGLFETATRIGPLMTALLPPLLAMALIVRFTERHAADGSWSGLRLAGWLPLAAVVLPILVYVAFETFVARHYFLCVALAPLAAFAFCGFLPLFVVAWLVRQRRIARLAWQGVAFGVWALLAAILATLTFADGRLDRGHVAYALARRIVGESAGYRAVVSEGDLDDMLLLMLPCNRRLIALARDGDPAYGRDLAKWVSDLVVVGSPSRTAEGKNSAVHCTTTTNNYDSDLLFAAELGPTALLDEWCRTDRKGFEAAVLTPARYFRDENGWREACGELVGCDSDEPLNEALRRILGAFGNNLGCDALESSDDRTAWRIFWKVLFEVEPDNAAAAVNLTGMLERGFAVRKDDADRARARRKSIEETLKSPTRIVRAVRAGGRVFIPPEARARYEAERREARKKAESSPKAREFLRSVVHAAKDADGGRAAREAIRKAVSDGLVRLETVGGQLIAIDVALGDSEGAEKDAIRVLRLDRHDPVANAVMGTLNGSRGDYVAAERYLRRAVRSGRASVAAKNDLAVTLVRLGRIEEAEPFAREAVKAAPDDWNFRETLASVLIRSGRTQEGAKELDAAVELAEKAGVASGSVFALELDRAMLLKAKNDGERFKILMRQLKGRSDLTAEREAEIRRIDW